jgi:hypothetical protein
MTRTAQPTTPSVTVEALVAEYNDAKGADKARIRRDAQAAMEQSVRDENFVQAGVYAKALALMVTAAPEKAAPDYAALIKARVATHLFAACKIMTGDFAIEGVPTDVTVGTFNEDDTRAIMAKVYDVMGDTGIEGIRDAAEKFASAKIVTGTKAPKHDVASHVRTAVATLGTGFHTVTKISNVKSDSYGDDTVSPGAVAAHFATKTWAVRNDLKNVTFVKKGTRVDGMTTDAPADGIFVA